MNDANDNMIIATNKKKDDDDKEPIFIANANVANMNMKPEETTMEKDSSSPSSSADGAAAGERSASPAPTVSLLDDDAANDEDDIIESNSNKTPAAAAATITVTKSSTLSSDSSEHDNNEDGGSAEFAEFLKSSSNSNSNISSSSSSKKPSALVTTSTSMSIIAATKQPAEPTKPPPSQESPAAEKHIHMVGSTLKSPPELTKPAAAAASAPTKRTNNSKTRNKCQSKTSINSSAHWEGEFALSILNAERSAEGNAQYPTSSRAASANIHNRNSNASSPATAAAAAASQVGAFAAKSDDKSQEEAARKKKFDQANNCNHLERKRDTFNDRLMRKLEDSRNNSLKSNSAGSSGTAGSKPVAKVGDDQEEKVELSNDDEDYYDVSRNDVPSMMARPASLRSSGNSSTQQPGLITPSTSGSAGSANNIFKRRSIGGSGFIRRMSSSMGSIDECQQQEYIDAVCEVTTTQSKDHMLDDKNNSKNILESPPKSSVDLSCQNGESSPPSKHLKRYSESAVDRPHGPHRRTSMDNMEEMVKHRRRISHNSLTHEEYNEFVTKKIAERANVGVTYSERKRLQEQEETLQHAISTVSAEEGDGTTETIAVTGANFMNIFYKPAPKVRDDEEEKVELSSEDDIQEEDVNIARNEIPPQTVESRDEKGGQQQETEGNIILKDPPLEEGKKASDAEEKKSDLNSLQERASKVGRANSPFSNFVAERDGQKIVTHDYTSDPEDMVVITDETEPHRVHNPNPDLTSDQRNNSFPGSFTGMVGRIQRGSLRSRSLYIENQNQQSSITSDPGNRRATFTFDGASEANEIALRELADMVEAQDVVQATLVEEDKPIQTVEAIPMDDETDDSWRRQRLKRRLFLIWGPLILILIIVVGAVMAIEYGGGNNGGDETSDDESISDPPPEEQSVYDPTLVQVKKEGILRCGVPKKYGFSTLNEATGEREGISVDYCTAVAAAVIGENYQVELIDVSSVTRFTALAGREIDLLIWGDTHTMERDFHEGATDVGFQFTDVYFYDGIGFAGLPNAVKCADDYNWRGECLDLRICVNAGTTHVDVLRKIFPQQNVIETESVDFLQTFLDSGCQVLAGEQNDISDILARNKGYEGEYTYGEKVLSKEPLAMVTRKNDQSWTDVVNWVLRALIHAEMVNITQANADELIHGHHTGHIVIDLNLAIKEVGNYGEIYAKHMEVVVPRKGLNHLYKVGEQNQTQTGILYSHPTGTIDSFRHEFKPDGKIYEILGRQRLVCGVVGDEEQSMDADYCRTLAASLFDSDSSLVDIIRVPNDDNMLEKLDSGELDVIAGVTLDYYTDIMPSNETASGLSGLAFSQPYFYGGNHSYVFDTGSTQPKAMASSQIDADWSTYVYWVVANSIWAEENSITSEDFRQVPEVKFFGDRFEWMFIGPTFATGNYGEIYKRNAEDLPPRTNHNLLNDGSSPQLWRPEFDV